MAKMTSQGETSGVGSTYSAALNERPNTSNTRNQGPTRPGSDSMGQSVKIVTKESRKTNKVG